MTNSEHFEKNQTSFAEVMEIFNRQKSKKGGTKSFDKFLASKHVEPKFKVGDIIVLQLNDEVRAWKWNHQVVFEVIAVNKANVFAYELKALTPNMACSNKIGVGHVDWYAQGFVDDHCILY